MDGKRRDVLIPRIVRREHLQRRQNRVRFRRVEHHRLRDRRHRRPLARRWRMALRGRCARAACARGDGAQHGLTRLLVVVAVLGEADRRIARHVAEHARHHALDRPIDDLVQSEPTRHRQQRVILQAAAQVRHLDRRHRPRDAAILLRVQHVLARIDEDAITIDESLIRLRLRPVVERDRIHPHILIPIPHLLLAVVTPVIRMPIEIPIGVMLERGPANHARVDRRRIDDDRANLRTSAVVEPILLARRALAGGA